jgi:hypothetical protein
MMRLCEEVALNVVMDGASCRCSSVSDFDRQFHLNTLPSVRGLLQLVLLWILHAPPLEWAV